MKHFLLIILGLNISICADFTRNNAIGIVTSSKTILQWQDNVAENTMNWIGAINYCENLNLGAYTDWRLPNFNELNFITDRSKESPAMSPVFQSVVLDYYWSSTSVVEHKNFVWGIDFNTGFDHWYYKRDNYYVRCVRDGQP